MSWWYNGIGSRKKHKGRRSIYECRSHRGIFQLLLRLDPQSAVGCKLLMVTAKVAGFFFMLIPYNSAAGSWSNPVKAIGQAESDLDALVEAQAETLCLGDSIFAKSKRRWTHAVNWELSSSKNWQKWFCLTFGWEVLWNMWHRQQETTSLIYELSWTRIVLAGASQVCWSVARSY